jgi:hypothetical protein
MYIPREIEDKIRNSLQHNPVTAITGPRQSGKSTLAKYILEDYKESLYLDLERPSDLQKLTNAEWFLEANRNKLICIDEIQRKPEIFPLIRSLVDAWNGNGHFLVLGSSSQDLQKQSSESLAGRISYQSLSPFRLNEINHLISLDNYLLKGGFPRSVLAASEQDSMNWRNDFITTFLERDLLQWSGFYPAVMRRLWQMLAHYNGQTANYAAFGNSLNVSNVTIRNYIDLLEGTFMLDVLPPYFSNVKKRLIKSPRIYIADPGITAALLGLDTFNQLVAHPALGAIWEQTVLSHLKSGFPDAGFAFYRSAGGAEMDIVMSYKGKTLAFECKSSRSPALTKGNWSAIEDIKPVVTFIVAPVESGWPVSSGTEVVGLLQLRSRLQSIIES